MRIPDKTNTYQRIREWTGQMTWSSTWCIESKDVTRKTEKNTSEMERRNSTTINQDH